MTASIIPAKAYSRRLPGKNMKLICGLPLVAWSVIQSVCSKLVDETYVSTDSAEIAEVCAEHGAKIIWRDYEQGQDDVGNVPTAHAIKKIKAQRPDFDTNISLLATGVLRKPQDIDNMIKAWREYNFAGQIHPVAVLSETFIYKKVNDIYTEPIISTKNKEYMYSIDTMSISTPEWYLAITGFTPRTDTEVNKIMVDIRKANTSENGKPYMPLFEMEEWQKYDIDYQSDFELAEILLEHFILKGRGPQVYYDYKESS